MTMIVRILSKEGLGDLWENLKEVIYDKSTRPGELMMAWIVFLQGLFWIFSASLFTRFASYELLYKHPGQTWSGIISATLSLFLIYGLIGYKRDKSHYDDVPPELWNKVDSYYGDNKVFMAIRRNSLVLMTGWTFYISLMMAIAMRSVPGWVPYAVFAVSFAFCLKRLRKDETEVRRALFDSRTQSDVAETSAKIGQVFSSKIHTRGEEDVIGRRHTDRPRSLGSDRGRGTSQVPGP